MELDIDVAVQDLIASASQSQKVQLAKSAGYADSGPTYDPSGNYLCGGCSFRLLPDKCAVVKGKISMTTGGCIIYHHGPSLYEEPLPHQFPQDQVIYTERPNVKGFGCKRCEYGKDEGRRTPHCTQWDFYVDPNACCFANEGPDDVVAPDLKAYGTSEGVRKAWESRERAKQKFETGKPVSMTGYHVTDGDVKFGRGGAFFSPEPTTEYGSKIVSAKLTFKNPLVVGDKVDAVHALLTGPEAERMEKMYIEDIPLGNVEDATAAYGEIDKAVAAAARAKGHDAIIYTTPDSLSSQEFQALNRETFSNVKSGSSSEEHVARLLKKMKGYGTSEGVEKAWDTRGRGQKDYRTDTGVHVGIFDRPEGTDENAISVTKYFGSDAPSAEERLKIADEFEKAVREKEQEVEIPISMLVPLQKTVTKDRLERAAQNASPKPVSVFHYNDKYYLIDGHHRVAGDSSVGKKRVGANLFHLPEKIAAGSYVLDAALIEAVMKMEEIRAAAEEELRAYGTSEGVTKAWDTRGRGRKEEEKEPVWQYPLYRGTTTQKLETILKDGLTPAEDPMTADAVGHGRFMSQKGKVYATYQEDLAKKYAVFKQRFNETEPGKEFVAWGMRVHKGKDGPPAIKDTKPMVVTVTVPLSVMKKMEDDPDSPPSHDSYMFSGSLPKQYIDRIQVYDNDTWKNVDLKTGHIRAEGTVPLHFVVEDLESFLGKEDLQAEALYHGVPIIGFSKPQEEIVRATLSRVPPELMCDVKQIVSAPELGAKHGRFDPPTKTVFINPHEFDLRQRFGEGQGWIHHMELTMVHEFMHSIYAFMPEPQKDQWRELSGWMVGTKDGQHEPYVEKRPGWEIGKTSKWTHKKGVKFPRHYSERNDDEDFADCAAYMLLGKGHMVDAKKKLFLEKLFESKVKNYPRFSVESPSRAYGEREIAYRGLQAAGWHGVDLDGTLAEWHGFKGDTHIGKPIPKMLARVKKWLDKGEKVKIVTARVSKGESEATKRAIEKWCEKYLGQKLEVTNEKDFLMIDLWDDRARRVEENTGKVIR